MLDVSSTGCRELPREMERPSRHSLVRGSATPGQDGRLERQLFVSSHVHRHEASHAGTTPYNYVLISVNLLARRCRLIILELVCASLIKLCISVSQCRTHHLELSVRWCLDNRHDLENAIALCLIVLPHAPPVLHLQPSVLAMPFNRGAIPSYFVNVLLGKPSLVPRPSKKGLGTRLG